MPPERRQYTQLGQGHSMARPIYLSGGAQQRVGNASQPIRDQAFKTIEAGLGYARPSDAYPAKGAHNTVA